MASQSGRFMSDDGRVAFATSDSLVEGDTNGLVDVYEFVGGRPQLISSGTAQADLLPGNHFYPGEYTGVEAISHDGVDIYLLDLRHAGPRRRLQRPIHEVLRRAHERRIHAAAGPSAVCRRRRVPRRRKLGARNLADQDHRPPRLEHRSKTEGREAQEAATRDGRRRATADAATPEGAGPMAERTDMSRVLAALAAAIAALALTWCFADQAHAVEEINEFDTHVSTTQAGGHPDVDYKITWTTRNSSNRPCNCEDARRPRHAFPHRIHRRSTQRSCLQADRIRTPLMPRGVPGGGGRDPGRRTGGDVQPRASRR